MARKVFVSYKYADNDVYPLDGSFYGTTVRTYVDKFERRVENNGVCIYKGEKDGDDLSYLTEDTIWSKLKERIYDSSVTIVFISPNMRETYKPDKEQWIPWEIAFSLREQRRSDYTSRSNALLFVVLPDRNGGYRYNDYMTHFKIVRENINIGYAPVVNWNTFMGNINFYVEKAIRQKEATPSYKVVKSV